MRAALANGFARTLAVAIGVAALAMALQWARLWSMADELVFDAFTIAAVPRAQGLSPVVVVGIDEPSFSEIGLRWPWPRELHARLAEELSRAGAAVVAFDVLFSEPSTPAADGALARAIRDTGRVVLASDLVYQETAQFRGLQRVEPLAAFREAGAAVGIASIEVGDDQVVRQLPAGDDAFWRVALDRYRQSRGAPAMQRPGPGTLLRYSDGSDVAYVSYYQALDAATLLPAGTFRGKIAIVGLALKTTPDPARRGADTYATPFLRFSKMYAPGVELQAQFIASALAGRTIAPLPIAWTFALGALALAAAVASMARWNAGRAFAVTAGGIALLAGASFALFVEGHRWLPVSLPCGVLLGMFIGRGTTAYLDEARRKREIHRAFALYVPPAVVSEMTAHPERLVLGGQRKEVTVLFTDLAGFTTLSEGMAPEEAASILNDHLTRMSDVVMRHGGTIDKFIGDAVMAFWGAPLDDPAHARHAVEAALEMQAEMVRWRLEPGCRASLHMRIGINTGAVVVGNLGSRTRFDYTVIGDAVNLASRLESANRIYGTGILLTQATVQGLGDGICVRHVDRIRVKGKREAIEVYTPVTDPELARTTALAMAAYRAREWDRSDALWREILDAHPADGIAALYVQRVARHRAEGVSPDWDGTLNLGEK
ncbi:MAG: CHASE2 domain-containing protein [Betaproteobacteria bacterium]